MDKVKIGDCWYDRKEDLQHREFIAGKEKELWNWVFSGQRTIDLFGEEGAKAVLRRQALRDKRLIFNHKSRGK